MARAAALAPVLALLACVSPGPVATVVVALPPVPPPAAASSPAPPVAATPAPQPPAAAHAVLTRAPDDVDDFVDGATMVTGSAPVAAAPPPRPARRAKAKSVDWACPFPPESDADQIDNAVVLVQLSVDAQGKVVGVVVVNDPGHGFGREAVKCARRQTFVPAADDQGHPVADTFAVNVRFTRPAP